MRVSQGTERSRRNRERVKETVYSCTLEYDGDLHPSFIYPIMYGMDTESPVVTYIPLDPYYTFPDEIIERNRLFDNTGVEVSRVEVSIPRDCSDFGLSVGPIIRHTEDINKILDFLPGTWTSNTRRNVEVYRESLDNSLHPFDRLELEMYRLPYSQSILTKSERPLSNVSIIRIIAYGTDLQENIAINIISDIIYNVLRTRLEYMKEVERRVSEKPLWKDISRYRDFPVILAIFREHMFILRLGRTEFFGYFYDQEVYDQEDTDLILIHGLNSEDNYIILIPDIYDPDSRVNQIINVLLRHADYMDVPWSFGPIPSEKDLWKPLLAMHDGCPGLL